MVFQVDANGATGKIDIDSIVVTGERYDIVTLIEVLFRPLMLLSSKTSIHKGNHVTQIRHCVMGPKTVQICIDDVAC